MSDDYGELDGLPANQFDTSRPIIEPHEDHEVDDDQCLRAAYDALGRGTVPDEGDDENDEADDDRLVLLCHRIVDEGARRR